MPVQFFEGTREVDDKVERRNSQRRVVALAHAIREHEAAARRQRPRPRPHDEQLYRRLRQIFAESGPAGS